MPRKRKKRKKPSRGRGMSSSLYELHQAVEKVRERNSGGGLRVYEQDSSGKLTRRGDIPVKELVGDDSFLSMVQERFGGGEYIFRVCDGCSRIVDDFSFSIGEPRNTQEEDSVLALLKTVADYFRRPVDDTAEARKRRETETTEQAEPLAEVQKPDMNFRRNILSLPYSNMPSRQTSPGWQTAKDLQAEEQELREQRKAEKLLLGTLACALVLGHFLGRRSSVPGPNPTGMMPSAQLPDQSEPPQTQGEAFSRAPDMAETAPSGGDQFNASSAWFPPIASWGVKEQSTAPGQLRSLGDLALHITGSPLPYQLTKPEAQEGDGDASELDAANPDPEREEDAKAAFPQDITASEPEPIDGELEETPQTAGQTGGVEDTELAEDPVPQMMGELNPEIQSGCLVINMVDFRGRSA